MFNALVFPHKRRPLIKEKAPGREERVIPKSGIMSVMIWREEPS